MNLVKSGNACQCDNAYHTSTESPRRSQRVPLKGLRLRRRPSHKRPKREVKVVEKESVESLNPRVEKRKQQCIHFFRGTCQKGDLCRYEHLVGDDGQPVPVGPEILQRFDDAVKRYNETRAQAQAKPKAAPRGGVSASMIILEPDEVEHGIAFECRTST